MQQYFVEENLVNSFTYKLSVEQAHHVKNVMRMKDNDTIRLCNNVCFLASIHFNNKDVFATTFELVNEDVEIKHDITLLLCMLKKDKFEWVIQKACELGVKRIVPVISSRTIVKVNDKTTDKIERYNKICLEACEQSHRHFQVTVEPPILYKDINQYISDQNIIAYENEKNVLSLNSLKKVSTSILIGPEGGFSTDEVEYAIEVGFNSVSLRDRILRAETAALYMLSVIGSYLDE